MNLKFGLRRRTWSTVSVVLALVAAPLGGVLVAGPAQASTWQAWVAKPSTVPCPSGGTLVSPTGASTDSLGVVHVKYASFPTFSTTLPPKGFNAGHASQALDADLATSGLKPQQAQQLAQAVAAPAFCESTTQLHTTLPTGKSVKALSGARTVGGTTGGTPSGTTGQYAHADGAWAGYTVDGGTGFNGVTGQWDVQQSNGSSPSPNDDGTWIGIGGDKADCDAHSNCSLIQEGTEMHTGDGYRTWFEYVGSGGIDPVYGSNPYGVTFDDDSDTVHVGDIMSGMVTWASTSSACFTLTDEGSATGGFSGCVDDLPVAYDSSSIEWIDEDADAGSTTTTYLADFGHTYWENQDSYSPSAHNEIPLSTFNSDSTYSVTGYMAADPASTSITPPCGTKGLDAYPSGISSNDGGSSTTTWCAAGPPSSGENVG